MKGYHQQEKGIGILFDNIFLLDGMRTAFGKYCGTLAQVSPTDLGIIASRATLQKSNVTPNEIDQLVAANIGQSSYDAYFFPRHVGLFSGLPTEVPALMVQRICGSGFETIITAAEQIILGKANSVLCTGAENMSLAPLVSFGSRMGFTLGRPVFKDMLWEALDDTAAGYPMGFTAENIAQRYSITRQDCDEFALLSFQRAIAAQSKKYFEEEIAPINSTVFEADGLKPRKFRLPGGVKNFASDEQVRETSLEALAKLNSVFSEVGVLTAGNCSGIVDGAASSVITTKEFIENRKLKPLSKIVAGASCGIDPKVMGLGPVPAIKLLLELTGLQTDEIGLIEINEAFSAQVIGCERELKLDREKLNVNGGAIAIGHPLAATGLRLSLTLSKEMKRRKIKYGIASACIGGGQGTAILFENTDL
ncbi:MAG TPA: thiolase family protein [Bacteroidia bacterium]|nr:thiolase family protein [Bacteroidia bacterium]QQR95072.1 MAG: thiolase family protein [Bacteroidota bacterium]MBP7714330.1 thiolase family protein [Bacteroidia bacterium]HQW17613.1 thiolase family protein [Bacteroidia bacterium]HQW48908.1 thiolase family protein [Bacteroidia bacterium]